MVQYDFKLSVDGWAISLLSKENVAWQSKSNGIGTGLGIFVSNTLFVILESTWISNDYIRPLFSLPKQEYGITNLESNISFFI